MKAHVPASEFDVKSNYANQPAPATVLPSGRRRHGSRNGNDDDINSDLDDSEDEEGAGEGEESQNIILCLYDKVREIVQFRGRPRGICMINENYEKSVIVNVKQLADISMSLIVTFIFTGSSIFSASSMYFIK